MRYAIRSLPQRASQWPWGMGSRQAPSSANAANTLRLRGRQLLDNEALACLLVLLFIDEPKLNTGRLHRVLRNLCYHPPTRDWIVRSLLSIVQRTGECQKGEQEIHSTGGRPKRSGSKTGDIRGEVRAHTSWLSISLDAALGCRANVFQIQRPSGGKRSDKCSSTPSVTIHPQASPVVIRHALDTLIYLAKSFPNHFVPAKVKEAKCGEERTKTKEGGATPHTLQRQGSRPGSGSDFWELLVKLDNMNVSRKGKAALQRYSPLHRLYFGTGSLVC